MALSNPLSELLTAINNLGQAGLLADLHEAIGMVMRKLRNEGMYQVVEYKSILELMDTKGYRARFSKRERVRFLQNNIIAFQDQAWGDGKILLNYSCTPGKPVDQYRLGYKTLILISLHEVKCRGDEGEFKIKWNIHKGFLLKTGFWGTEINHDISQVKTQIIFPAARPPKRVTVQEKNRGRTILLTAENAQELPDGRWLITWEKSKPVLHEQYIMSWEW